MIRLNKGAAPQVLLDHAPTWTAELLTLVRAASPVPGTAWDRYKHPEIKAAVRRDSWDKCIYCESKILHVAHGDIEHIRPKSRFPELAYDWSNLGLVCTKCNTVKGNHYPETPPLDPYQDDPTEYLIPVGELIWPRPGNDRAQVTESLLKLNRAELVARRRERLEAIRRLVDAIARARNGDVRGVLMEQLQTELADPEEYLLVSRAIAAALSPYLGDAAA